LRVQKRLGSGLGILLRRCGNGGHFRWQNSGLGRGGIRIVNRAKSESWGLGFCVRGGLRQLLGHSASELIPEKYDDAGDEVEVERLECPEEPDRAGVEELLGTD
jgi:hypothetical protein